MYYYFYCRFPLWFLLVTFAVRFLSVWLDNMTSALVKVLDGQSSNNGIIGSGSVTVAEVGLRAFSHLIGGVTGEVVSSEIQEHLTQAGACKGGI